MLFKLASGGVPLLSLFSVFLFLPLSLIVYYSFPQKHREKVLLGISLVFIILVAPRQLPFILAFLLVNYVIALEISGASANHRRYRTILLCISLFLCITLWAAFGFIEKVSGYFYLLGCGVIPFLVADTNLLIYRRKSDSIPSLAQYFLYSLFFPRLFVGPFDSLSNFFREREKQIIPAQALRNGFGKFARGGVQFTFLGTRLLGLASTIGNFHLTEATKLSAWTIALSLALGIYHTFAGFSSVVEGIGEMFGFSLPNDWNYPFGAKTVVEFARRFHGSLENFLWRNLHVWSLKKKYGKIVQIATVIVIGGIIGLWIDFSLAFMLWGIFIAVFAIIEFFIINKRFKEASPWLTRGFTFVVILFSFALLTIGYTGWDPYTFSLLFGLSVPFVNPQIFYYLNSYLFLLLLGMTLTTDIVSTFVKLISSSFPNIQRGLSDIVNFLLFIVLIILLV